MKKILIIFPLIVIAACAAKEVPFDPVAKFKEAETYMHKESFEKARKAYQEIQEKSPDRSYDADIMLRVADTYYGEEKYDEAQVEYQAFLNFHPVHRDAPYAQFQIALCSFKQLSTIDRDPEITRAALKEFEKLLSKYPKAPYVEQAKKYAAICRDRLAEYELYVARFYYKKGSYKSALGRLEGILKNYPSSLSEKDTLYYLGLAYKETGERAKALDALETLARKYPSMSETAGSLISKLRTR
jgi:outer membrane protein assembly factor BamD